MSPEPKGRRALPNIAASDADQLTVFRRHRQRKNYSLRTGETLGRPKREQTAPATRAPRPDRAGARDRWENAEAKADSQLDDDYKQETGQESLCSSVRMRNHAGCAIASRTAIVERRPV